MKSLGYMLRLIILARQTKPQLKPRTSIDSGFRVFPDHYITRYLPNKHKNKSRGFTLIELMVVIVIAGMLVTFASLSISNSSDKQLETEAKRFVSLVKFAADESIMNTREIILKIEERKYSFVEPGLDNSLIDMGEEDPVFRARELPDHMHISGEIAGEILHFEKKKSKDAEPDFGKVGIFSSGEMTPFDLVFSQDDGVEFDVSGDYAGKVEFLGKRK